MIKDTQMCVGRFSKGWYDAEFKLAKCMTLNSNEIFLPPGYVSPLNCAAVMAISLSELLIMEMINLTVF